MFNIGKLEPRHRSKFSVGASQAICERRTRGKNPGNRKHEDPVITPVARPVISVSITQSSTATRSKQQHLPDRGGHRIAAAAATVHRRCVSHADADDRHIVLLCSSADNPADRVRQWARSAARTDDTCKIPWSPLRRPRFLKH